VQHGTLSIDVPRQEDRRVAALERGRIEFWYAALVRLQTGRRHIQLMQRGRPPSGDQDALERCDARRNAGPRKTRSLAVLFDVEVHAQMDREFPTENRSEVLRDLGVAQRRDVFAFVEHGGLDAQSRQRLSQFETKRAGADDRDRTRKRLELEYRLVREYDIAELVERFRHGRARTRGDHNSLGRDLPAVVERERSLVRETSPLPDTDAGGYLLYRLQRFGDEPVALLAHACHDGATVYGRGRFDAEHRSPARVERGIRRGDKELRGHASDAGARRPGEAVVDQNIVGARLPRGAFRGQTRRPSADDSDVAIQVVHLIVLPKKSVISAKPGPSPSTDRQLPRGRSSDGH
jgi:hypothetical protein